MGKPLCGMDTSETSTWERVQKLAVCRQLLQRCCDEYDACHGVRIDVDERNFATAFFSWLDLTTSNADYRNQNAPDYFQFAFGVLLRELLQHKAVRATSSNLSNSQPSPTDIPRWWPIGYMLTFFCFGALKQTVQQECGIDLKPAAPPWRPAVWQSFREHVIEESSLAIGYFDKFMGIEPNWREPSMVANRPLAALFEKRT
ncbi:hypothetical protein R69746_07874 [Paraburkholderia aspalathi]|uniref:hypothetical protein n=1 Tax=Paraburkholderia aspalathi TaxID=1324617 RepID=UPI001909E1A9|nr:hypothetical protein [Paraburkholderia aspalathi]MBK3843901.1 hypothetical protein [Paraburkholderia aspalathi]CAE6862137.1 hypothetical protein R69746_07874 [Paraburkholderia aspalathi]